MKKLSLVLNYSQASMSPSVGLEQESVPDNSLTTTDLYNMLALVRSGVSAKLYKPDTCNVTIVDGNVLVDLFVYTWPKPYTLDHTLSVNFGAVGNKVPLVQNREFDFIINLSRKIELPFCVSSISYELTQLPFFDSSGNIVDTPNITFDDRFVYIDAYVIGVIRIKCVAMGYQHTVSLAFPKGTSTVTSIDITASATWYYQNELQTAALQLELPGCLELLLETCEDDLITEHSYGSVKSKDILVPVVYFSDCDGSFLAVRNEKP